jgi:hypothetical protein
MLHLTLYGCISTYIKLGGIARFKHSVKSMDISCQRGWGNMVEKTKVWVECVAMVVLDSMGGISSIPSVVGADSKFNSTRKVLVFL